MRPPIWLKIATWWWWRIMHGDFDSLDNMLYCLKKEKQSSCDVVFERGCSNKCKHCIYAECAISADSSSPVLHDVVCNIVKQLPRGNRNVRGTSPNLIHLGRTFKPQDLQTLLACRKIRPDLKISMINNGQYVKHLEDITNSGFLFNNLDFSVDGTRRYNNLQRNDNQAFQQVMRGIKHAKEIVTPGGTVNVLCTITTINFCHLEEFARLMLEKKLITNLIFSMMTPEKTGTEHLEISSEQFANVWLQLQRIFAKYNTRSKQRVFLQIYRHQDMQKIINVTGVQKFWEAFNTIAGGYDQDGITGMFVGKIRIRIGKISFFYSPSSISVNEGILVDADGSIRAALCQPYTLAELTDVPKLHKFTFKKPSAQTDIRKLQTKMVLQWWKHFGQQYLREENETFRL